MITSTVQTVLDTDKIADIFTTHYHLGTPTHCELIRAGFNHNYLIETGDGKYVLRVYLKGKYYIRNADDFRFELDLLNFLHKQGLPVVRPIANHEGEWLTTHVFEDANTHHLALFHFAHGVEIDKASANGDLTDAHVEQIGEVKARIHQVTDNFQSPYHRYHLNLSTYLMDKPMQLLDTLLRERQLGDLTFLRPITERLRQQVSTLTQTAPTYGIIHADMHGNNILLDNETGMTVIDFDHCAYGWRVYDFMVWRGNPEVLATVLRGYESVRKLSSLEKELMPVFAKLQLLWDIGDVLLFKPLWGEEITNQYLEECVQVMKDEIT
ncbi:MAG: phosphotransferase [Chloroflexota bacterium]